MVQKSQDSHAELCLRKFGVFAVSARMFSQTVEMIFAWKKKGSYMRIKQMVFKQNKNKNSPLRNRFQNYMYFFISILFSEI